MPEYRAAFGYPALSFQQRYKADAVHRAIGLFERLGARHLQERWKDVFDNDIVIFACRVRFNCARHCRIGTTHLSAIVQRLTGDSPMALLRRIRVRRAENLLRKTDMSVTSIAMNCGFSTSQLFARTFKQYTNHTPSEYRRYCKDKTPPTILEWTEQDELNRFDAVSKHEWI
ncbi:MAG: helix-turn-helix transcriptional regulator [bacterium]|nr:helix-turn-helix transcriptional regulator [bacterium]